MELHQTLHLPKLLSDGCVLQRSTPVRIWGWSRPQQDVTVAIQKYTQSVKADEQGKWQVTIDALEAGGPFPFVITSEDGSRIEQHCYVGDVFLCSGQSNMELPMSWVAPEYPGEFAKEADLLLRQYKVVPEYNFARPQQDHSEASWQACDSKGLPDFSAVAYFFGRSLREHLHIPIGLLNVSLGGSPLESWMDESSLGDFPTVLNTLNDYLGEGVAEKKNKDSVALIEQWHENLYAKEKEATQLQWHDITLPTMFNKTPLRDFRGEIELRKTVFLPQSVEGEEASLHLGTMVDSDITRINNMVVGSRTNQYELRDYTVPSGVLRSGANEITIRLTIERGNARVTPGKAITLICGDSIFDVSGRWEYAVVSEAQENCPWEEFVQWKPTGLYNAMLAPCFPYAVKAVLWYQGESNTGTFAPLYSEMFNNMMALWREKFKQPELPFLIVQLPNFSIDGVEDGGWPVVREQQWVVAESDRHTATVVTIDSGAWNDLHPTNKKPIGERLYLAALGLVYGEIKAYVQPKLSTVDIQPNQVNLYFEDVDTAEKTGVPGSSTTRKPSNLRTLDGNQPGEFAVMWVDGSVEYLPVTVAGNRVTVDINWRMPDQLRYAWSNNPQTGLLCNDSGVLVAPFTLNCKE